MDLDFSLVLVIATLLCGIGWGLDLILTSRRRLRHATELAPDGGPLAESLRAEPVLVEYAHSFFPVLAVVLVLRSFLLEPFTIPSGSMLPTLEVGDYILVNKYAYGLRLPVAGIEFVPVGKPERGDVMVFRFPPKPTMNFIKRVVGLPGDRIRTMENGDLYVNDQLVSRVLVRQEPEVDPWEQYFEENLGGVKHATRQEMGTESRRKLVDLVVPEGHYFMMGDNRDNSNDSRYWGTVPDRMIVGKAVYIWVHKDPGLHAPTFSRNGAVK
ncbi:MAG TPA: signal peptidase I [Fluviicoccus sp.]|nr:signal peptidase I [Fluviicoccus sp.]